MRRIGPAWTVHELAIQASCVFTTLLADTVRKARLGAKALSVLVHRIVAAAPDLAIVAAQERRQLAAAAARWKLPTAQDADRLWDKYEKAKALQEAAELGAAKQ